MSKENTTELTAGQMKQLAAEAVKHLPSKMPREVAELMLCSKGFWHHMNLLYRSFYDRVGPFEIEPISDPLQWLVSSNTHLACYVDEDEHEPEVLDEIAVLLDEMPQTEQMVIYLIDFGPGETMESANEKLEKWGYRPATLHEGLSFLKHEGSFMKSPSEWNAKVCTFLIGGHDKWMVSCQTEDPVGTKRSWEIYVTSLDSLFACFSPELALAVKI
jgi:hypothetical protein